MKKLLTYLLLTLTLAITFSFGASAEETTGLYKLVATPDVVVGSAVIPGAYIEGAQKVTNNTYVAFAPIGKDYRADVDNCVYVKCSEFSEYILGDFADYLGYAFSLTLEDGTLKNAKQCNAITFINYGDHSEISATYITYDYIEDSYRADFFLTFGENSYNLVSRKTADHKNPTGTSGLILYYDFGEDRAVPVYKQVLDVDGNIVDEYGSILLYSMNGAYYKQNSNGQYIKANQEEIDGALARFDEMSSFGIIEQGDIFFGSSVLGTEDLNAVIAIANNKFCEITALDYDNDGIFDAAIYRPYYVGYVGQVKDYDNNTENGNEFILSGVPTADGSRYLLAGSVRPNVNDYVFKGAVLKPASWLWYLYSYNRFTHTIDVKEVAKSVKGKVQWAIKGEEAYEDSDLYLDSQTQIGDTVYKIGGWNYYNLLGYYGTRSFNSAQIKQPHIDFIGRDVNGDGGIDRNDVSLLYNNGWNDILDFGVTDACSDFMGYAIAGHLIHGLPLLRTYDFVAFDIESSNLAVRDDQIIVDKALVDKTGNFKEIAIDSIDGVEFTDIEFEAFCNYIDVLYGGDANISKYAYYFDDTKREAYMSTDGFKACLRAKIIDYLNAEGIVDSDGNAVVPTDFYALDSKNDDGSYNLSRTKRPTLTNAGIYTGYTFEGGKGRIGNSTVQTSENTVFTFVAADGIFVYKGMPKDGYGINTYSSTRYNTRSSSYVVLYDPERSISEMTVGDCSYTTERINADNTVYEYSLENVWEFEEYKYANRSPVNGIALDKTNADIKVGESIILNVIFDPENATYKDIVWTTSDESIATVKDGTVTGVKVGTVVITATALDGNKSATCTIKVSDVEMTGLTLDKTEVTVTVGEKIDIKANILPENASGMQLIWFTANNKVVELVSHLSGHEFIAVAAGTAVIGVKTIDDAFVAKCNVTVKEPDKANIYTESKKIAVLGSQFEYKVYLSGTYDGFTFKLPNLSGLEIINVEAASTDVNVDMIDGKWTVSIIGGWSKIDSEKTEVVTVTVEVSKNAELGERVLSLEDVMVTTEQGDVLSNVESSYAAVTVTDQVPGDVNGDGKFDYSDVAKLYALFRKKTTVSENIDTDINGDGQFNYSDVSKLYAIFRKKATFN